MAARKEMTLGQLARAWGVSRQRVWKWHEESRLRSPSGRILGRFDDLAGKWLYPDTVVRPEPLATRPNRQRAA